MSRRAVRSVAFSAAAVALRRALVFRIAPVSRPPEAGDDVAVGLDQGDVDDILRRPAHQADSQNRH
jgi:hypothetical protein